MRRFVEAHLVPASPWEKEEKIKTLGGKEVWWVVKDGSKVIMPDEVEVERVASQVGNGELVSWLSSIWRGMLIWSQWILKGVLNYA